MKDFFELQMEVEVRESLAEVYKKAIEGDNDRYLTEHKVTNAHLVVNDRIKAVWSGNYVVVNISDKYDNKAILSVSIVSHTKGNLAQMENWFLRTAEAKVIHKNY